MKQKKRSIRLFILISLLLVGICLETVKTNSLSAYAASVSSDVSSADPGSAITPAGKPSPIPLFVSEKSSGHQETAISTKRRFEKADFRTIRSVFSCFDTAKGALSNFSTIQSMATQEISRNISSHMIITSYIHLKDGQKP